jgi:hypothetical protein
MKSIALSLKKKGVWHLVGPQATRLERAQRWVTATVKEEDGFDPLMVSILEISQKAKQLIGDQIVMPKANGQHCCPLCEANKFYKKHEMAASWIDNCSDLMLLTCQTNGLI